MRAIKKIEHIALILDGNGRWAKNHNKLRSYGHKVGMQNIFPTVLEVKKHGIKHVTMFCFSTENWNRPKLEVVYLMKFPGSIFSKKEKEKYIKEGIRVNWIGRRSKVPNSTRKVLEDMEDSTRECNSIILNIAIDYGAFEEIESSFKTILHSYVNQNKNIENFKIQELLENLYTKNSPPVDLLIRTGGEQRISNFMLLQLAYAELYFTPVYWPDFSKKDLQDAIEDYGLRDRRFGRIVENEKK